jgi:hypothetical protein
MTGRALIPALEGAARVSLAASGRDVTPEALAAETRRQHGEICVSGPPPTQAAIDLVKATAHTLVGLTHTHTHAIW